MPSHRHRLRGKRLVIGITGRIGAGKTSAAKYLSSEHSFQYLRYSQVLSDWRAKDPESKTRLQEIGWEVMAKGMQSELNRQLIAHLLPDVDVAVDGLRHPIDYESLDSLFGPSFHLLYIDGPSSKRWEHLRGKSRYASFTAFESADSHPVEQQIESLRVKAALVLRNEGPLQDLYAALDTAIRGFRKVGHT